MILLRSRKRGALVCMLGVLLPVIAGIRWGGDDAPSGPAAYVYDGLQQNLTLAGLAGRADAVVVGDVTQIVRRLVTDRAAITEGLPDEARDNPAYGSLEHSDATVQVVEYLKGDGPQAVRVPFETKIGSENGAKPPIEPSGAALGNQRRYVLFITKGTARLWSGRWLMMGENGILSEVAPGSFQQPGTGKSYTLEEIREAVEQSKNNNTAPAG